MEGQLAAKQFVCKSDGFATSTVITSKEGEYYTNFPDAKKPELFVGLSVGAGQERQGGAFGAVEERHRLGPAADFGHGAVFRADAADNPAPSPESATEKWAVTHANSANHIYDGQNVGFGDAHAEFTRTPACGQNNDSIWGIRKNPAWADREEQPIAAGALPHALSGKKEEWDVVMVPTRDGKGNLK